MTAVEFCEITSGKPWVNRAEGMDAFDCWGLVIASFRHVDGCEMPESSAYHDVDCSTNDAADDVMSSGCYAECEPCEGAIACCYTDDGIKHHVGRILAGRVLHCSSNIGVRHDTLRLFIRTFKNVRFYRYHANHNAQVRSKGD